MLVGSVHMASGQAAESLPCFLAVDPVIESAKSRSSGFPAKTRAAARASPCVPPRTSQSAVEWWNGTRGPVHGSAKNPPLASPCHCRVVVDLQAPAQPRATRPAPIMSIARGFSPHHPRCHWDCLRCAGFILTGTVPALLTPTRMLQLIPGRAAVLACLAFLGARPGSRTERKLWGRPCRGFIKPTAGPVLLERQILIGSRC